MHGRLIDIGCGIKPYQILLSPYVSEHIGVDQPQTFHAKSNIDLFSTAYEIGIANDAFDCAICTSVLEHLEEPEIALRECFRVIKPGGRVIYSVPFIWHLHEEPRDYYRFSKYGLQYLFEKVGFEILEIKALSGFWVTFGTMLAYNVSRFNKGLIRHTHLLDMLILMIQGLAYIMEKLDKPEQWTWGYMVLAGKK